MRKLAIFIPSLGGGGAERVMVTLANEFIRQDVDVDFIVVTLTGHYKSEVSDDVNILDLECSRMIFSIFKLARYLREQRPDALLSTIVHSNLVALLANKISGSRTPIYVRESSTISISLANPKSIIERMLLPLVRRFYPQAEKVIAPSLGVAEGLVNDVGLKKDSISVIYNPVSIEELYLKSKKEALHPWLECEEVGYILGVGRLTKPKDFSTLIEAFRELKLVYEKPLRLIIIGEGEMRDHIEELINRYDLEDQVSLPGFIGNPFPIISNASCFVLSSIWEGLPNVLIQALALGVPVVSTNCKNGPIEILENGKWGELVDVGNYMQMSKAILHAIDNCKYDSERTMEYCAQRFGAKVIARQYLDEMFS